MAPIPVTLSGFEGHQPHETFLNIVRRKMQHAIARMFVDELERVYRDYRL